MEVLQVIKQRRSERFFLDDIVSVELVDRLVDAATHAPTSCNMQVYNITLVNDPQILYDFSKEVTGKVNWTKQLFVLSVDPLLTFEKHANYISAGMVAQNLMLAAKSLGLATCAIAGFSGDDFIKERLGMPEAYDIPLLIFFGYPKNGEGENVPRKEKSEVFGVNAFCQETPFPKSSDIKYWSQDEIIRYRERILPVYYPRLRHGNWSTGLQDIWNNLEDTLSSENGRIMYIFPTELDEFEVLEKYNSVVSVADTLESYTRFLGGKFTKAYHISDQPTEKFDKIFLHNKLMFQKDLNVVFNFVNECMGEQSEFFLSTFNDKGIVAIIYKILRVFGKQKDVYHSASFYKYGPYRFVSKREVIECCKNNNLSIVEVKGVKTSAILSKIPNKLKFISDIFNYFQPETISYKICKKGVK